MIDAVEYKDFTPIDPPRQQKLILELTVPDHLSAEQVANSMAEFCEAIDAMNKALGGPGMRLESVQVWQPTGGAKF